MTRRALVFILAVCSAAVLATQLAAQTADQVYTTVTPCRLLDTRLAGGAIAPGSIRNIKAKGTNLSAQGGSSSGCGIASGATGAIINFVAVDAAGPGHIKAWAYPEPTPPTASILNYAAVGLNIANGIAVPLCSPGACSFDIRVQANVSATHVVADIYGYFTEFTGKTFAVCSSNSCLGTDTCGVNTSTLSFVCGPCTATSETGSCMQTSGSCAVCKPGP